MPRTLTAEAQSWPIAGGFRISRGIKTEARVVVATIAGEGGEGRGEGVPYRRYGESVESAMAEIAQMRDAIEQGLSREALQEEMRPGAARNALDCALIDWEAKARGVPAHAILGVSAPKPVRTAYTLSLDEPAAMADAAAAAVARGHRLLKLKIAGGADIDRVAAVRNAAPDADLIADANEGWTFDDLRRLTPELARLGVALLEQPLPAAEDAALEGFASAVPLCADEACHTRADLDRCVRGYSHINVKLDKSGGLTEAVALVRAARTMGLGVMVGCMVSTSLAMASAIQIAGMADFVDLDGPLLLARDREHAIRYAGDTMHPPEPALWG